MRNRFFYFLLGAGLFWLAASQIYDPANPRIDFSHDYAAGLLVRAGSFGEIYAQKDGFLMPEGVLDMLRPRGYTGPYITRFFSHPFYALLMVPFTYLPYRLAASVFLALQIGLWALWLWALFREKGPLWFLGGLAVLLLFYPARAGLEVGQAAGFLIPLAGYFALRPDKTLSQLGLALMFLVKPVAILLPLLLVARRNWRGVLVFAAGWLFATLLAVLIMGKGVFLEYLGLVAQRASLLYLWADTQSALAVLYRLLHGTTEALELESGIVAVPLAVRLSYYGWVALALGATAWGFLRGKSPFRQANLLVAASLIVIPFAQGHYFGLALVPLLGATLERHRTWTYLLLGGGFLLMNLPHAYYSGGLVLRFLSFNMFAGALLVFGGYLGLERA